MADSYRKDDPNNAGLDIAQKIPGVGILQMLRQMGEQGPGMLDKALEMLGIKQPPPPPSGPLPRGFQDAQGNPVIVQPGQMPPPGVR